MKKLFIVWTYLFAFSLSISAQSQTIDEILKEIEKNNKTIQAAKMADKAAIAEIDASNTLEDPSIEYSSLYNRATTGQAESELIITQGFDFPTTYTGRNRFGRIKKEAIDWRQQELRQNILLEAELLCLDIIRLNKTNMLLNERKKNADKLLELYKEKVEKGDASKIDFNKTKIENMNIQTALLTNDAAHRKALQDLLALNGNKPLAFEATSYPPLPEKEEIWMIINEAISNNPSLKAIETDSRAALKNITVSKLNWLPKIEIGYRRNTADGLKEHGFIVGGSIPVFSNKRNVEIAKAQAINATLSYEDATLRAKAQLESQINEFHKLDKAMSMYDIDIMYETLDMMKENVERGESSLIDYFSESEMIYQNLQAYYDLECQYQKVLAQLLCTAL